MGFFDWIWKSLSYLGLYKKKASIVFLGLDNAGKSTLLAMLKNQATAAIAPTQHPTSQVLEIGSIKFKTYDLGGHEVARKVWEEYVASANAIVYLVDIADRTRFAESRVALQSVMEAKQFKDFPILILANKIDLPSAVSVEDVVSALKLQDQQTGKEAAKLPQGVRPLEVFPCSVIQKEGYAEGFRWLSKYV
ncbi:GTP-binding_protein Sar1 [Hexamita inflata]|uniref:GTP-binding protein Sar1 n=1 Tax=Hexamita inflata TaxID=28002 RepID=A0AA86QFW4_9EUKA|nr:GTP-binding protein Sar1 [Hexamita inflata]CAI9970774.1 GTP-binding protein Sar1 [Hexamita inflata]